VIVRSRWDRRVITRQGPSLAGNNLGSSGLHFPLGGISISTLSRHILEKGALYWFSSIPTMEAGKRKADDSIRRDEKRPKV